MPSLPTSCAGPATTRTVRAGCSGTRSPSQAAARRNTQRRQGQWPQQLAASDLTSPRGIRRGLAGRNHLDHRARRAQRHRAAVGQGDARGLQRGESRGQPGLGLRGQRRRRRQRALDGLVDDAALVLAQGQHPLHQRAAGAGQARPAAGFSGADSGTSSSSTSTRRPTRTSRVANSWPRAVGPSGSRAAGSTAAGHVAGSPPAASRGAGVGVAAAAARAGAAAATGWWPARRAPPRPWRRPTG